jgi:hypothetical protein
MFLLRSFIAEIFLKYWSKIPLQPVIEINSMPTALLKNGETVQVPIEDLEQFIQENEDNIVIQHVKRRGKLRRRLADTENVTVQQ